VIHSAAKFEDCFRPAFRLFIKECWANITRYLRDAENNLFRNCSWDSDTSITFAVLQRIKEEYAKNPDPKILKDLSAARKLKQELEKQLWKVMKQWFIFYAQSIP